MLGTALTKTGPATAICVSGVPRFRRPSLLGPPSTSAQAPRPYDCPRAQRAGHELGDRALQVAPELERVDRAEVVQQHRPGVADEITGTI